MNKRKVRITNTGYLPDSPDRHNPMNIIPSNQITMDTVPFPILGIDNLGNHQIMMPGMDYTFPGHYVTEIPMGKYQKGREVTSCGEGYIWSATQKKCIPHTSYSEVNRTLEDLNSKGWDTNQLASEIFGAIVPGKEARILSAGSSIADIMQHNPIGVVGGMAQLVPDKRFKTVGTGLSIFSATPWGKEVNKWMTTPNSNPQINYGYSTSATPKQTSDRFAVPDNTNQPVFVPKNTKKKFQKGGLTKYQGDRGSNQVMDDGKQRPTLNVTDERPGFWDRLKTSKYNPNNWDLPDYSDLKSPTEALYKAAFYGEPQFMWRGRRTNTQEMFDALPQEERIANTGKSYFNNDVRIKEPESGLPYFITEGPEIGNYFPVENLKQYQRQYTDALNYTKEWLNSPMYKKMLLESSAEYPYEYAGILNKRRQNLEETEPVLNLVGPSNSNNIDGTNIGAAAWSSSTGDITMVNNTADLPLSDYGALNRTGHYTYDPRKEELVPHTPETRKIEKERLKQKEQADNNSWLSSLMTHEFSHHTDKNNHSARLIPKKDNEYILNNQRDFDEFKKFYEDDDRGYMNLGWGFDFSKDREGWNNFFKGYAGAPTEVRARLQEIRRFAKDNNIYDPFIQEVDDKSFEKLLKANEDGTSPEGFNTLLNIYTPQQIQYMLNHISENKTDDKGVMNNEVQVTKNGGSIYLGHYKFENGGLVQLENNPDTYAKGGKVVSEIWTEKTGLPWNAARKMGLSDGSYERNIQLREELLQGAYDNIANDPDIKIEAPVNKPAKKISGKSVSTQSVKSEPVYKGVPHKTYGLPLVGLRNDGEPSRRIPTFEEYQKQKMITGPVSKKQEKPVETAKQTSTSKDQNYYDLMNATKVEYDSTPESTARSLGNVPSLDSLEKTRKVQNLILNDEVANAQKATLKPGEFSSESEFSLPSMPSASDVLRKFLPLSLQNIDLSMSDIEDFKESATKKLEEYGILEPSTEGNLITFEQPPVQPKQQTQTSEAKQTKDFYIPPTQVAEDNNADYGEPENKFWGFRYQNSNDSGLVYVPTPRREKLNKNSKFSNVQGVAHFLIQTDATDGFIDPRTKAHLEKDLKEGKKYVPFIKKESDGKVRIKYAKGKDEQTSFQQEGFEPFTTLRTLNLNDIDWNKTGRPAGFKSGISNILTKDGKDTWLVFKEATGKGKKLGQFNGGALVFIVETPEGRVIRDFTGTIQEIENESKRITKEFGIPQKNVTLGFYDAGSYTAKPKANKNNELYFNQYSGFNVGDAISGASLMIPSDIKREGGQNLQRYSKGGNTSSKGMFLGKYEFKDGGLVKAQEGKELDPLVIKPDESLWDQFVTSYFNPFNWGEDDYSDNEGISSLDDARRKHADMIAAGEDDDLNFMFDNKRHTLSNQDKLNAENRRRQKLADEQFQKEAEEQAQKFIHINDPRKIRLTSGKPINPNVDLVTKDYDARILHEILKSAKQQGLSKEDALNAAAIGFQESGWGSTDGNIGHVTNMNPEADPISEMIWAYLESKKTADRLKFDDPDLRLQVYNGTGTIKPETEQKYHGFKMKKIYGVPVPAEGLNMKEHKLYGKQIRDIRDNVLLQNPSFTDIFNSYYPSKKRGGLIKAQTGKEMPFDLPLKEQNIYLLPEYNQPRNPMTGEILPDPQRPNLGMNTGATEYKYTYGSGEGDIDVPSIVAGQYIGDRALDRYMLTGERFKTMNDPGSYSKFYDQMGQLGLMQERKGGSVRKVKIKRAPRKNQ